MQQKMLVDQLDRSWEVKGILAQPPVLDHYPSVYAQFLDCKLVITRSQASHVFVHTGFQFPRQSARRGTTSCSASLPYAGPFVLHYAYGRPCPRAPRSI